MIKIQALLVFFALPALADIPSLPPPFYVAAPVEVSADNSIGEVIPVNVDKNPLGWQWLLYESPGRGGAVAQPPYGDGTFGDPVVFSTTVSNFAAESADVDGDGWPDWIDLVWDQTDCWAFVVLNTGAAPYFSMGANTIVKTDLGACTDYPTRPRMVDVDNDGKLDLFTLDQAAPKILWSKGNGNGTFTNEPPIALPPGGYGDVSVFDCDPDGADDIMVGIQSTEPRGYCVLHNLKTTPPTWSAADCRQTTYRMSRINPLDFDGDGILDFATTGGNVFWTSLQGERDFGVVMRGRGGCRFDSEQAFPLANQGIGPSWCESDDVNGDGIPDLVCTTETTDGGVTADVWLGNGDGTFRPYRYDIMGYTGTYYPVKIARYAQPDGSARRFAILPDFYALASEIASHPIGIAEQAFSPTMVLDPLYGGSGATNVSVTSDFGAWRVAGCAPGARATVTFTTAVANTIVSLGAPPTCKPHVDIWQTDTRPCVVWASGAPPVLPRGMNASLPVDFNCVYLPRDNAVSAGRWVATPLPMVASGDDPPTVPVVGPWGTGLGAGGSATLGPNSDNSSGTIAITVGTNPQAGTTAISFDFASPQVGTAMRAVDLSPGNAASTAVASTLHVFQQDIFAPPAGALHAGYFVIETSSVLPAGNYSIAYKVTKPTAVMAAQAPPKPSVASSIACRLAMQRQILAFDGASDDLWAEAVGYFKKKGVLDCVRDAGGAYAVRLGVAEQRAGAEALRRPQEARALADRAKRGRARLAALPGVWRAKAAQPKLAAKKTGLIYCGRQLNGRSVVSGCKTNKLYVCVDHC